MLTRRNFLKGLLSSVAAAALVKNGIVQPERWTIDMGANTWRQRWTTMTAAWNGKIVHYAIWDRALSAQEIMSLSTFDSVELSPLHYNCQCVLASPPLISQELLDDSCAVTINFTKPWMTGWGITDEQVRARIAELKAGGQA